jgi:hypothetical protein
MDIYTNAESGRWLKLMADIESEESCDHKVVARVARETVQTKTVGEARDSAAPGPQGSEAGAGGSSLKDWWEAASAEREWWDGIDADLAWQEAQQEQWPEDDGDDRHPEEFK